MSNLIYPKLQGEGWPVVKRPMWSTEVQVSSSGMEVRTPNYPYERYQFEIPYEWMSSNAAIEDLQTLMGFYNARGGAYDSFLFDDVTDDAVLLQPIGTGNGSTTAFQLQRTLGTATRPVYDINGIIASTSSPPTITVYLNGVSTGSYSIGTTGLLTFGSAPGSGVAITASFGYFWRCRFSEDQIDFENFANQYWSVKKVVLQQVRS